MASNEGVGGSVAVVISTEGQRSLQETCVTASLGFCAYRHDSAVEFIGDGYQGANVLIAL